MEDLRVEQVEQVQTEPKAEQAEQVQTEEPKAEEQFKWDAGLFEQLVSTPEGKKEMEKFRDKGVTRGIESWKTNNLQKLVDEGVAKEVDRLYPTDPNKKRIAELEQQLLNREIQNAVMVRLEQAEIPTSLSQFFIGETVEDTVKQMDDFIQCFNDSVNTVIKNRVKQLGWTPKMFNSQNQGQLTKADLKDMTYEQRVALYNNGFQHLFK